MVTETHTPLFTADLSSYRVAIIAGANGIGRVITNSLVDCDAYIFVSDADDDALTACDHPGMCADAGVPAACKAFVNAAAPYLGGSDVLVNDAGIAGEAAFAAHVRPEAFDATISIDLAFMFHWARRAIPALPCFVTQKYIANMALYPVSPFGATISGQAMNVETDMQTIM